MSKALVGRKPERRLRASFETPQYHEERGWKIPFIGWEICNQGALEEISPPITNCCYLPFSFFPRSKDLVFTKVYVVLNQIPSHGSQESDFSPKGNAL
jgi:hypothetical protein